MFTKIITMLLTNDRARKTVVAAVASILAVIFLLLYGLFATPWTMLTGWMEDAFNGGIVDLTDPDAYKNGDNLAYHSMADMEAYRKNFQELGTEYTEALTTPYLRCWNKVQEKALRVAEDLGEDHKKREVHDSVCEEDYCSGECSSHSIVYSTFHTGERVSLSTEPTIPFFSESITVSDCDPLNSLDIALIVSYFNNVGLEWDCYAGNHQAGECKVCDQLGPGALTYVLDAMDVPKDPVTGEYIGALASVNTDKLIDLIERNLDKFFVAHIPDSDGSCSLGAQCTLGHEAKLVSVSSDELPTTYAGLRGNSSIEEPYFGIYYNHRCEDHEHLDDEGNVAYTDHIWHTDHTAVGFVEYRGIEFIREYLHLEAFEKAMPRVEEAYSNMRSILGLESSSEHSLQMDSLLAEYEPKVYRSLKFPSAVGNNTKRPIRPPDGSLNISAYFNDDDYLAILGEVHWAIDMAYPIGTPVYATSMGEVVRVQTNDTGGKGFGRYVVTYQGKNSRGDKYFFIYAHLNSVNVSEGMPVSSFTRIGSSGNTGNSTGPHLHYECRVVRADGTIESIDPLSAEGGMTLEG